MDTPLDLPVNRVPAMSIGDWLITYLITAIPIINIIMLFVWAFGNSDNTIRSTWAKATLVWFLIIIVIYTIFMMVFGAAFLAGMNSLDY
jgi:hypothetical protein